MAPLERSRRLIVNGDDFGRSRSINAAIIRAHREGILTTASLMVSGRAAAEAVELARQNPRLGVGLHLTLVSGRSALPSQELRGLVDAQQRFRSNAVAAGLRYFLQANLREPLRREIREQCRRFHLTGLRLDHLNGHLNVHLHPTVLRILTDDAAELGFQHLRLTRDPFWLNVRVSPGRWLYRVSHALIFSLLARWAAPILRRRGIRPADHVFGLLQNAAVNEDFLTRLLPRLPAGDSELYCHPSLGKHRAELEALISPRVKALVQALGIPCLRYQDL